MANNIEEGMPHVNQGLSFIDWDNLDHDEYSKLTRIISTSNKSTAVQLLFVEDELNNLEEEEIQSSENSEVLEKDISQHEENKEEKVIVDIKNSVLHPAAPVFQPSIPPPIMPFPIAVPHHWPHADPTMPPPQPQANPYTYPVPGGYVFHPDPNLVAHNGEATMAFVTLSNGQPVYAFPGHPIPAHHFQPTTLASGIPPLPTPTGHTHMSPQDVILHHHHHHHPVSGAVIPTTPSHHPLVFQPHITTTMGQPLPAHIVPPNTVSQHLSHNQHSTQFMYVPQMPPASSVVEGEHFCADGFIDNESAHIPSLSKEGGEEPPENSTMSCAIPESSTRTLLSEIEFGGPVVFDKDLSFSNSSSVEPMPLKSSPKDKPKPAPSPVQEVVVHTESHSPSELTQLDNTENTVVSIPESKAIVEPVHIQESSVKMNMIPSSSVNKNESSSVNETISVIVNSDSSDVNANAKPQSPIINNAKPDIETRATQEEKPSKANPKSPLIEKKVPSETANSNNTTAPVVAPVAPKTWSSLFGQSSKNVSSTVSSPASPSTPDATVNTPNASSNLSGAPMLKSVRYWQERDKQKERNRVDPFRTSSEKLKAVDVRQDPLAPKLIAKLADFPISHIPIIVQPRGLKNGNNICFMNATLQVLMGCPPFIHLFRAFRNLPARTGSNTSTPVFDALVQFVNTFQNCQRTKQQGPAKNKKGVGYDVNAGVPFIPESLLTVAQDILGLNIGVQHDAEEFLSQILSICNEEVEKIIKMKNMDSLNNNSSSNHKKIHNGSHRSNGEVHANNHIEDGEDDGDDSWVQVGHKNHCVETNVNNCGQTPLSAIFAGLSRSCLVRESGKTSDTLDSFFTLKMDIQADSVHSVRDALIRLNATEEVHSVDGRKVNGHRRMFFEVLPPVLIMHLKLFEYSNGNGQKIQKKITFDVDLQIPKELISRGGKSKYPTLKSRSYKLFGVVNHHGTKMNDGHYTSDVFLPIVNGWLHFDDSDVSMSDEATVLHYVDKRMPYLLFYRRMDVG